MSKKNNESIVNVNLSPGSMADVDHQSKALQLNS